MTLPLWSLAFLNPFSPKAGASRVWRLVSNCGSTCLCDQISLDPDMADPTAKFKPWIVVVWQGESFWNDGKSSGQCSQWIIIWGDPPFQDAIPDRKIIQILGRQGSRLTLNLARSISILLVNLGTLWVWLSVDKRPPIKRDWRIVKKIKTTIPPPLRRHNHNDNDLMMMITDNDNDDDTDW